MKLPQYTQTLPLYASDLMLISELLVNVVRIYLVLKDKGYSLTPVQALQLKPANKLAFRCYNFSLRDMQTNRVKPRLLRVEYDELLVLNAILREYSVPGTVQENNRIRGLVDQASLNLEPQFIR